MDKSVVNDFLKGFDDSRFPKDFLKAYEALECLGYNEQGETLLVKERTSGTYFVAKCYDKTMLSFQTNENQLLKELKHKGLPAYIGEYQNDTMQCVVREFIEGNTLDIFAQERIITCKKAITIGIGLCDVLIYLHSHTPPIIHRDIKPQNIILDKEENANLIDFGISRLYDEKAKKDTDYFGTMEFAAPEQYGFSQTDCRTDIFSLGVVLCWLLTGETDIKEAIPKIEHRYLRHILNKCVSFAPEKRYSSASKVKKALLRADRKTKKKIVRCASLLLVCGIFLCVGFTIGRYSEITPCFLQNTKVHFQEPLIENAVRLALHKSEGSEIRREELQEVTELYIFGNRAADSEEEFDTCNEQMMKDDKIIYNGGIGSLQDVALLKNLRVLKIALQNVSDLSPLSNLDKLEMIELKHNPIEDLSPLQSMPALKELYLYDTGVSDFSILTQCPRLENLVVGKTHITSIKTFSRLKNLMYLHASGVVLDSLSGIEEFTNLQEISFYSIKDKDLSPLLSLPKLKKVYLSESMQEAAESIKADSKFEVIYQE